MATYTKAGHSSLGIWTNAVYSKTGAAAAVFTVGGATANLFVETGAGVQVRTASGFESKGQYTKSGAGILVRAASGADTFVPGSHQPYVKTGAGFMGIAQGAAPITKAGTGISRRVATGASSYPKIFVKANSGDLAPEPPSNESDWPPTIVHVGSGGAVKVTGGGSQTPKAGASVRVQAASGADVSTHSKTGAGIQVRTCGGAKVVTFTDKGAGILVRTAGGSVAGLASAVPDVYPAVVATVATLTVTVTDPAGTVTVIEDDQLVLV